MKIVKRSALSLLCSALLLASGSGMAAGLLTGQVAVSVTIGPACTVGNGSSVDGINNWGTINFGTYGDLNSAIDGNLIGDNGSSTVTINCSAGITPTLTLNAGANAGSAGLRYMANGDTKIGYRLYSDAGRSVPIVAGTPVALDSGTQSIPIYARILPDDQTVLTPSAATYQDTVIATLAW